MSEEQVILVDPRDQPIGSMEKMEAHRKALLHRAFSVFIFNSEGDMLLQQRAFGKYHSAGLWTNACCSHPRPGESTPAAAARRLSEELGFTTGLQEIFSFIYRSEFENGLTEHEFDHVFAGVYEGPLNADPGEVVDFAYRSLSDIRDDMTAHPQKYTAWFHLAFPRVADWLAVSGSRLLFAKAQRL